MVVLPTPEWVPAMTMRPPSVFTAAPSLHAWSVLDALARPDTQVHGVFDLGHVGDGVGDSDDLFGRIATRDDHIGALRARGEHGDELVDRYPAVLGDVGCLVEDDQVVLSARDLLGRNRPRMATFRDGLVHVGALPGEAVTEGVPFDTEVIRELSFARLPLLTLDELYDDDLPAPCPGAAHDTEGRGTLAFPGSGIDDESRRLCHSGHGSRGWNGGSERTRCGARPADLAGARFAFRNGRLEAGAVEEAADPRATDSSEAVPTTLRRGWTTGACATAATKAAFDALCGSAFPDLVEIELPRGKRATFALAFSERGADFARAGVVKDAGDDPDVTHGVMVVATLRRGAPGAGVVFRAGHGVGTVTLPGLPVPVGEPAINPVPREMMRTAISSVAEQRGASTDVEVEISIPGGDAIAHHTWNPRLGIVGGLSILGTTGVVIPYSCSAWIDSIRRGIDIAVAVGHSHVAGCTGRTSEAAVQARFGIPDSAMLDMGDFAGAMLRYLRDHPVPRLTIGGGFAKLSKLAVGALDLHSGRSSVDLEWLASQLEMAANRSGDTDNATALAAAARRANTAAEVLEIAGRHAGSLALVVASTARATVLKVLDGAPISVEVVVVARDGAILATTDDEPQA